MKLLLCNSRKNKKQKSFSNNQQFWYNFYDKTRNVFLGHECPYFSNFVTKLKLNEVKLKFRWTNGSSDREMDKGKSKWPPLKVGT